MTIHSVLCAVDFSPESSEVLRAAMTVAGREHAALTVLHVLDPLLVQAARIEYEQGVLETSTDKDLQDADREGRVGPRRRSGRGPSSPAHRRARPGNSRGGRGESRNAARDRHARLQRRAPDVLRLDRRARHQQGVDAGAGDSAPRAAAGRIAAWRVALLVPLAIHRLLVAVDFTTECMHAIREAAALASRWNLALTLLHAVPPVPGFEQWKTFLDLDQDKRIERARHELELLAREVANERLAVRQIAVGGAAEEVIDRIAAEEPGTLVVMGLRAPSLLPPGSGATAYRLLCTTSSPILVVPDTATHARQRPAKSRARATARG